MTTKDKPNTDKLTTKKASPTKANATKPGTAPANTAKSNTDKLHIVPLGGIGEIGKNMTAIRCGDEIITGSSVALAAARKC